MAFIEAVLRIRQAYVNPDDLNRKVALFFTTHKPEDVVKKDLAAQTGEAGFEVVGAKKIRGSLGGKKRELLLKDEDDTQGRNRVGSRKKRAKRGVEDFYKTRE